MIDIKFSIKTNIWEKESSEKLQKIYGRFTLATLILSVMIVISSFAEFMILSLVIRMYSISIMIISFMMYVSYQKFNDKQWEQRLETKNEKIQGKKRPEDTST